VSRLKNLQAKVAWYQRARLSKGEELWLSLCHLALNFIVLGNPDMALPILAQIGWELPEEARRRLAGILSGDDIRL
jgi:hypothetical protein